MAYFMLSEPASMNLEATSILNGFEETTYLKSYLESTGDEPPCLHITPNSTSPSSLGGITSDPRLSLTRYQWQELYEAWRLETVLPDVHRHFRSPQRVLLFTPLTDSNQFLGKLRKNWPTIARMMYICVKKSSSASLRATLLRNYASST